MQDGIIFEKQGVPAASVATHVFINMGRASAAAQGMTDYPFVVIEHPIGRLTEEEMRAKAEAALPEIVKLLLE